MAEATLTVRELVRTYQREIQAADDLQPDRAADLLMRLTALIGNVSDEIRAADAEYAVTLLHWLDTESKANRAKIRGGDQPGISPPTGSARHQGTSDRAVQVAEIFPQDEAGRTATREASGMTKEDFHRLLIAPSTRLLLDRMQADNARVDAALKAAEARRPVTTDELFERR